MIISSCPPNHLVFCHMETFALLNLLVNNSINFILFLLAHWYHQVLLKRMAITLVFIKMK